MERYEARLTIAENSVQKAVASAYALCEMLAKGNKAAETILSGLEAADDSAASGLAQLAAGLSRAAQILGAIRQK